MALTGQLINAFKAKDDAKDSALLNRIYLNKNGHVSELSFTLFGRFY